MDESARDAVIPNSCIEKPMKSYYFSLIFLFTTLALFSQKKIEYRISFERAVHHEADIEIVRVPGAFELPLAVDKVAGARRFDGVIALGAVIRGGTPHFDYVAGECVKGVAAAAQKHNVPVGFGILTVDTIEQAIERAGTKAGNKGEEATLAVIEMVNTLRRVE